MKRAKVITNCVADKYSTDTQRIVEFVFPNGEGGLIEFYTDSEGHNLLHVYRTDQDILITVGVVTSNGKPVSGVTANRPAWAAKKGW